MIGNDEQAIADVFQETMLAVARAGRNLSDNTILWAWLARIAHNQVALYWRKQYRTRDFLGADAPADITQTPDQILDRDAISPAQQLSDHETVLAVRQLLAEMKPDYTILLTAKYLDGLTIQQLVEQLGGSAESIRSRLARARRDFRQRFAHWEAAGHPRMTPLAPDPSRRGDSQP